MESDNHRAYLTREKGGNAMTLARQADLARAAVSGSAKPRNKQEREFLEEFSKISELNQYERMESLEYELTLAINKDIYAGYDLDKLLVGEDPWPKG